MSLGREVADAYIEVHGDLEPFRRDLQSLTKTMQDFNKRMALRADSTRFRSDLNLAERYLLSFGQKMRGLAGLNVLEDTFEFGIRFMQNIDRNAVRIAKMATLIGGAVAAFADLTGFVAAVGADLASLGSIGWLAPGFLTGFGIALGVSVAAFKDMKVVLKDLKPAFQKLQDTISAKFWDQAAQPIRNLANAVLPTLNKQLGNVATSMGRFFGEMASSFQNTATPERMTTMFGRLVSAIDIGRKAIAPMTRALVNLGEVGSKYFERFANWVVELSTRFDNFIARSIKSGEMERWIERAIQGFKDVGRALSASVGIIDAINDAFRAAGGGGLTEFANRLQAASDIMNSPAFQEALTKVFVGARAAMDGFFSGLGRLGPAFSSLGDTFIFTGQRLGEVFDNVGIILRNVLINPQLQQGFETFMQSISNSVRNLAPAAEPFANSLGGLLALMGRVLQSVSDIGAKILIEWGPVFDKIGAQLATMIGPLQETLTKIIDTLTPAIQSFSDNVIGPAVKLINEQLLPAAGKLAEGFGPSLAVVFEEVKQLLDDLNPAFKDFNDSLGGSADKGRKFAEDLRGAIQAVEDFLNASSHPLGVGVGLFGDTTATEEFNRRINQAIADFWTSVGGWIDGLNTTVNTAIAAFWAGLGEQFVAGWTNVGNEWNAFWTGLGTNISVLNESVNAGLAEFWAGVAANITAFGASVVEGWNGFWSGLGMVVQNAWNGILEFLNGIYQGIQVGMQGFILGVATFWGDFWANLSVPIQTAWTTITLAVQTGIAQVGSFFAAFGAGMAASWNAFWGGLGAAVSSAWVAVTAFVQQGITNARNFITTGLNAINSFWTSVWNNVRSFASSVWSGITSFVSSGINNTRSTVSSGLNAISSVWNSIWGSIRSVVSSAWSSITSFVSSGISRAQSAVSGGLSSIRSFFSSAWSSMTSLVSSAWSTITSRISSGVQQAISFVGQLPARLGAMAGQMLSAGVNMMNGFVQGVMSMAGRIVQSALDAVGSAVNAVKNFLGIHSPSRLFQSLGEMTGEGLAIGMDNMAGLITKVAEDMAGAATSAFSAKSMYQQGRDAAQGLADGFASDSSKLDRIMSNMTPTAISRFEASAAFPMLSGAAPTAAPAKSVTFEAGAFTLVTPTKDPELVVHKVMDEFANDSNF